jgi:hypothetical protein
LTSSRPKHSGKLPDASERQRIFYWLQRISSVTAWRRVLAHFEAWAIATENSVRLADEKGWADKTSLSHSEYALILKCLAHCEAGVQRLSKGDKRVFKFDADGEFAMAVRMLTHWVEMLDRIEIGDSRVNPYVPLWEPFCVALEALSAAWRECAPDVLQSRFIEDPAPTVYGLRLKPLLQTMPFPAMLDPVPDPSENIFVRTGLAIPFSGIWEPVAEGKPTTTSLLSMFKRAPDPHAPFEIAGAMNYLHGGSKAPQVNVSTFDDIFKNDTTWRLIWKDERYLDGIVPAIEAQYQFAEPQLQQAAPPAIGTSEDMLWAESGAIAAVSGKWLVESDPSASVNLQKGEKLPLHEGCVARWVPAEITDQTGGLRP